MVVALRAGVVKAFPVAMEVPPVGAVNQLRVAPAEGVANMVTEPAPQRLPASVELTEGVLLMVAVTIVRAEVHPLSLTSTK